MEDLLKATIFLEEQLEIASNDGDFDEQRVSSLIETLNVGKSSLNGGTTSNDDLIDDTNRAIRLLARHAGFSEVEEGAVVKLRNELYDKMWTMARQFIYGEQRQKDKLPMPYMSPLMWVLNLNHTAPLTIRHFYDATYTRRFDDVVNRWKLFNATHKAPLASLDGILNGDDAAAIKEPASVQQNTEIVEQPKGKRKKLK